LLDYSIPKLTIHPNVNLSNSDGDPLSDISL